MNILNYQSNSAYILCILSSSITLQTTIKARQLYNLRRITGTLNLCLNFLTSITIDQLINKILN